MGLTNTIDVTPDQRKTINRLLHKYLPHVEVWAYGSRVKWTSRPNSDLDVVALTKTSQRSAIAQLKEAFEESNLPFRVDLFAWNDIPEQFHKNIEKHHFVLQQQLQEQQEAIAHILGSLDDKIELNRQINTTLESMAQSLFKSWFVDFDPVLDNALAAGNPIPDALAEKAAARKALGDARKALPEDIQRLFPAVFVWTEEMGWIPEGWQNTKLPELLEVKYGKDHKKLNEGNIPVYGSGGLMRHVNSSLHKGESILIPRKGTLSNLMYVDEEFWSVDTMFFSIPRQQYSAKYLFYTLKALDFAGMNVGSAVPSITTKVLNDLNMIKPAEGVLKSFDDYASDLFIKKRSLEQSSGTLEKLRDTLLPKLLSGELCIPDAQKLTEQAL